MVTVEILKDQAGSYKGISCLGHAEFAKPGKPDIVCAAVSTLVIGTINSLTDLAGEDVSVEQEEESGLLICKMNGKLQEKSSFLVDSMIFNLENIKKEYGGKYLKVKFKEV